MNARQAQLLSILAALQHLEERFTAVSFDYVHGTMPVRCDPIYAVSYARLTLPAIIKDMESVL